MDWLYFRARPAPGGEPGADAPRRRARRSRDPFWRNRRSFAIVIVLSLVASTTLAGSVLAAPNGETSFWHLDEGVGTVAGDSTSSLDGALSGPAWASGVDGTALDFSGSAAEVVTVADPADELATGADGELTVSFWYRVPADPVIGDQWVLLERMDGGGNGYRARLVGPGQGIEFLHNVGGVSRTVTFAGSSGPAWHHVVAVVDTSAVRLYVDGSLVDTQAGAGSIAIVSAGMRWGLALSGGATTDFEGSIDEIAVYPGALAASDVTDLYDDRPVVVNSTGDSGDAVAGDGACDTGASIAGGDPECTLRAAIEETNANAALINVDFSIPVADAGHAGGIWTITPGGALPTIAGPTVIDATSQNGYTSSPIVVVDGSATTGSSGIQFGAAGDSGAVRGLRLVRFDGDGVFVDGAASGVTVADNWIGTDGSGAAAFGNNDDGIDVRGTNTTITGNVINNSGDEGIDVRGTGTTITGNYVGVEPDGVSGTGNSDVGIAVFAANTTIGGDTPAERNVISKNWEGIEINSSNNAIRGNYIGVDSTGAVDAGNRVGVGVQIQSGTGTIVGGTNPGESNVIAYNQTQGVQITGGSDNSIVGNSIHSNGALGIDLGPVGVTPNDAGDGDSGANDLLNFPVIGTAIDDSSNLLVQYTIDVPAGDYRVEFFTNPSGDDPSGFGEAETLVDSAAISGHAGGAIAYNATVPASGAATLTATLTEDLGGGSFGSTSEIAAVRTVSGPFVVNSTADAADSFPGDAVCDTGGTNSEGNTECTLRAALEESNAANNTDVVNFDIPTSDPGHTAGVWTISPGSDLPLVTERVTLDASTQPGFVDAPIVELDGSSIAASTAAAIYLRTSDSEVRGFALFDWPDDGIEVDGNTGEGDRNVIAGNWVGITATGALRSIVDDGITVRNGSANNIVGGAGATDANVVGGTGNNGITLKGAGTTGNRVLGNYVGVRNDGPATPIANATNGIYLHDGAIDNRIGEPGAGNTVRFNAGDGVHLSATALGDNTILANAISDNGGLAVDIMPDGPNTNDANDPDAGPNDLLNHPEIVSATVNGANIDIDYRIDVPNGDYVVEFYSTPTPDPTGYGELATFVDRDIVTGHTDGSTVYTHSIPGSSGDLVAATVTEGPLATPGSSSEASPVMEAIPAGTVIVNSTGDSADTSPGDGACNTGGINSAGRVECTLAAAISEANINASIDTIQFSIPASEPGHSGGVWTISQVATLESIDATTTVDARTQPGWVDDPLVELDGTGSVVDDGIKIETTAPGSAVYGLAVINFTDAGIWSRADDAIIAQNFSGVRADGSTTAANSRGIEIWGGGKRNRVEANTVSGNTTTGIRVVNAGSNDNEINGNFVGTDPTGSVAVPNGQEGVVIQDGTSNEVGSTQGNVISGNGGHGVRNTRATSTVIENNLIGVDAGATGTIPNGGDGVFINDTSAFVSVGTPGSGNTIGGNAGSGVVVNGASDVNSIRNNLIGTDAARAFDLGNTGHGVLVEPGTERVAVSNNTIGNNGGDGIRVDAGVVPDIGIIRNETFANGGLGIDLEGDGVTNNDVGDSDGGANELLNFPIVQTLTPSGPGFTVDYVIDVPAGNYVVDFYTNPSGTDPSGFGESEQFLISHVLFGHPGGSAAYSTPATPIPAGAQITGATYENGSNNAASELGPVFDSGAPPLVVNSTSDAGDSIPGDGACDTGGTNSEGNTECTLRAAIEEANADPGADSINFSVPASDPNFDGGFPEIRPGSAFPDLVTPVTLDGTTQPGYAGDPLIEVDGASLPAVSDILVIDVGSDGSGVRALSIVRSPEAGIFVDADGTTIVGNWIGVRARDGVSEGNRYGVVVSAGATNTTIGGSTAADRNVIAGQESAGGTGVTVDGADATTIDGNWIGFEPDGSTRARNDDGIRVSNGSTNTDIGVNAGNVIAGNEVDGILVLDAGTDGVRIHNNLIGVLPDGTTALDNRAHGVAVQLGAANVEIGAAGAGNVIGASRDDGVEVLNAGTGVSIGHNFVGTDVSRTVDLANIGSGIKIVTMPNPVAIVGNAIANNDGDGVIVNPDVTGAIRVEQNDIFDNSQLAIDLDDDGNTANDVGDGDAGSNGLLNHPVITSAAGSGPASFTIDYDLDVPAGAYTIHFFRSDAADPSGFGEAQTWIGSQSITATGGVDSFSVTGLSMAPAGFATAQTIADADGSSSEIGNAVAVLGPTVLEVNSSGDAGDDNPGDGTCETGGTNSEGNSECTLRAAIEEANATVGPQSITFSFPITDPSHSAGRWTITPATEFAQITDQLIIDGSSQPGYAGTPVIVVDGSSLAATEDLIEFATGSDSSRLSALTVVAAPDVAIWVEADSLTIIGNYVGTRPGGGLAGDGSASGIRVDNGAVGTVIGGPTPAERNVISGNDAPGAVGIWVRNGDGTQIDGNWIGVEDDGTTANANNEGVRIGGSTNTSVGTNSGNVISGNLGSGVRITSAASGVDLQNNLIGLSSDGLAATPNSGDGILLQTGVDNIRIGASGAGNVISGNVDDGVQIVGAGPGVTVEYNQIGTDAGEALDLGNQRFGVRVDQTANAVSINRNTIAHNDRDGVLVNSDTTGVVEIFSNKIYDSGQLAIDLDDDNITLNDSGDGDTGPNGLLNFPEITSVDEVSPGVYTIDYDMDVPAGLYRVDFYQNQTADPSGYGEAESAIGSQSISVPAGGGSFTTPSFNVTPGQFIAAQTIAGADDASSEIGPTVAASVAATMTVNSTGDAPDADTADGLCDTGNLNSEGNPECTHRAAIEQANTSLGITNVDYNIPTSDPGHSSGIWTLTPATELPAIALPLVLDATTQPGYAGDPVVQLDGSVIASSSAGILIEGDDSEVRGFIVHSFPDEGIEVDGSPSGGANNIIAGNWVGIDSTGAVAGNADSGILIVQTATGNVVGGPTAADANIVGGNLWGISVIRNGSYANTITGNFVGVLSDGATPIPNTNAGIRTGETALDNRIEGNIVRSNSGPGVLVAADSGSGNAVIANEISGNTGIGIDLAGDGVTANDAGDADVGVNDLLNFPVLTDAQEQGGTVTVDFDLDVPAGNYRIDFYSNPNGTDPSGFGEGEVVGGFSSITHTGSGVESFTGSFPAAALVGDVTATATIDLGTSLGSTSEFGSPIAVQHAPAVTNPGDQTDDENDTINLTITGTDPDGDTIGWSAANLPPGLTINPTTGQITGTLPYTASGTYNTTITADDSNGGVTPVNFTWTINNINRDPVVTNPGDQTDDENDTINLTITGTDPDGDTIGWSATNLPPGLTINPTTGQINGTLPYTASGTYNTTITADDSNGGVTPVNFTWTVNNINRAPSVTGFGDLTHDENETRNYAFSGTDPDGDPLTWTATNLPPGMSINPGTGLVSGTLTYSSAGIHNVTITATDPGLLSGNYNFTWTVDDVNRVPVVNNPGDQTDDENDTINLTITGTDPDGDTIGWSATNLPPGLTINPTTGQITGTLPYTASGTYNTTITADDSNGDITPVNFTWTINNINRAPTIDDPGTQSFTAGQSVTVSNSGSDPDGDALTWSASNLPPGLTIDPTTGQITGTLSSAGTTSSTITATDPGGLSDSVAVIWTVSPPATTTTTTTTTAAPSTTTTTTAAPSTTTTTTTAAPTTTTTTALNTTTTEAPNTSEPTTTQQLPTTAQPSSTTIPPLPFADLDAREDRVAADTERLMVPVLANDSYGENPRIVGVFQPSVGVVEVVGDQIEVVLPESFAGDITFAYTLTDDSGRESVGTVVVFSVNVLSPVDDSVSISEDISSLRDLLGRVSSLFLGLLSIKLSTLQLSVLALAPLVFLLMRVLVAKREDLVAITNTSRRTGAAVPLGSDDDVFTLRHDAFVWRKPKTVRTRKGVSQVKIELPNGKTTWINANAVTDTGY